MDKLEDLIDGLVSSAEGTSDERRDFITAEMDERGSLANLEEFIAWFE